MVPAAALGDSFRKFFDSVDTFFSNLTAVHWGSLLLALLAFAAYLTLRSRASFNILRAAYPDREFSFLPIAGAYWAGYGFNNVVPARGGDVIRLFLTKTTIPESSYSAIAAAFAVEAGFDLSIAIVVLTFAFTQGVFPKPPDFSKLNAFDLSYFASHPQLALFVVTVLAILALASLGVSVLAQEDPDSSHRRTTFSGTSPGYGWGNGYGPGPGYNPGSGWWTGGG